MNSTATRHAFDNLEISIGHRHKDTADLAVWMKYGKKAAPFCAAHIDDGVAVPVSTIHERFPLALQKFCEANGLVFAGETIYKRHIGATCQRVRLEVKNWTLYAAEQASGLQGSQIKAIEAGDKSYTIDALVKYCSALGITIDLQYRAPVR